MSDLQKAFQRLQPYLIGIRYVEDTPIIDVQFKEGWHLANSKYVTRTNIENEPNHFMLFSNVEGIGLDELLNYLETTIKANIEYEKKVELLKKRISELKELFKDNTLIKLQTLKFKFSEEDPLAGLDARDMVPTEPEILIQEPLPDIPPELILPTELSEEDQEIIEEERRAKNFLKLKETEAYKKVKKPSSNVELPPRKQTITSVLETQCDCGPDEACSKCMDSKDL